MGILFNKLSEPVVLKESSSAYSQIQQLEELKLVSDENVRKQIDDSINLIKHGISGEERLLFELKNSHMPMYILRDLYFEMDGLSTQIDFLVVTRMVVLIIECKNLYGNITIDEQGNFTRTAFNGKKEGIYSPISQNQRHLDMIRMIRRASKGKIGQLLFDKNFDQNYKSVVVLANTKSVIHTSNAPSDVKKSVIKIDLLNSYIKKLNSESRNEPNSDKEMQQIAEFFLSHNKVCEVDYTKKFKETKLQKSESECENTQQILCEDSAIYQALKEYRYKKSISENVKAYCIFTNAVLDELVSKKPSTFDELKNIKGLGEVKCQKYGNDILSIIINRRE